MATRKLVNAPKPARGRNGGPRPNSGRKSKAEEMGLQRLLDTCWTPEARRRCIKGLAEMAEENGANRMKAIELLMAYTFGKPKEKHEHDGAMTIRVIYDDGGSETSETA